MWADITILFSSLFTIYPISLALLCYRLVMKSILIPVITALFLVTGAFAQSEPVKMSKSGICHAPNTTYYNQTRHFTPYPTLKDCLNAGGRMPKK
jgi:hypothetical protein